MEKKHDYNFCPSCGQKLQGDETICPFCGYRLRDLAGEQPQDVQDGLMKELPQDEEKPFFCPTCNTRMNEGDKVCSYCGFRPDGLIVTGDQNVTKKTEEPDDDGQLPVAEVPKEKKIIDLNPVHQETSLNPGNDNPQSRMKNSETSSQQTFMPPAERRKGKKGLVIALILIVVIGLPLVLMLLQYTGAADIPGFRALFPPKKPQENVIPVNLKNYYYCYASGINGKTVTVVMSNVFSQEHPGNSMTSAEASFLSELRAKYPKDQSKFRPVLTKKFSSAADAGKDREEVMSAYMNKKYVFRFVDVP